MSAYSLNIQPPPNHFPLDKPYKYKQEKMESILNFNSFYKRYFYIEFNDFNHIIMMIK